MIETRGGFRFPAKTRQSFPRIGVIIQHPFERDDPSGMPLPSAINNTHPAAPDLLEDFVIPQPPMGLTGRQSGEDSAEVVLLESFLFSYAGLEQAAKAEAAGDTGCRATMWALVRLMLERGE